MVLGADENGGALDRLARRQYKIAAQVEAGRCARASDVLRASPVGLVDECRTECRRRPAAGSGAVFRPCADAPRVRSAAAQGVRSRRTGPTVAVERFRET